MRLSLPRIAAIALASAVIWVLDPSPSSAQDRVRVFAAASLTQPLTEILSAIPNVDGIYASSGTLARQIQAGAPADIYVSAHPRWTDHLVTQGVIASRDVTPFLQNALVLVAGPDKPLPDAFGSDLAAFLTEHRLAIGDPDHVPAGQYARQALTAIGLWSSLEGSAVRSTSVRAVLAYVERGAVGYGIVYESDAAASQSVAKLRIPDALHDPILYTIALLRDTPAARAVLDALKGADSQATLSRYGFTIAPVE